MSIETLSFVMIFCEGICIVTVRKDTRHLLDGNEDEREPRPAHALEFSEKKYDAALVLPQHAKRADEIEDYRSAENVGPVHGVSIWFEESQLEIRRKSPPRMTEICPGAVIPKG